MYIIPHVYVHVDRWNDSIQIFYNLVHKSTVSFLSAAPRPKPFEADKAYFSEVPKLVAIPKQPGKTLGLSIMTREVSTYTDKKWSGNVQYSA